ncbi:isochorismatase family cysteine hydrolase [Desertihabitans aurantiacus]|uniref:isochorismatase family cysteine hydrolase n=1 Tax=Desertihabitans aurantiacus TaxID=2282477 RepID=UPI000DF7313F|nr:isochorismatase family cysteine hydrolase [Desertihabitans aurantiacus]
MTTTPTDSTRTAVLVIDMQNDTVHPDGAYASTGAADHAASQQVVANVAAVTAAARAAGVPVVYSRIVVHPLPGLSGDNAPIFRMLAPDTFKIGTWGAEIVDELAPQPGELVLDRTRMSVFNGTEIDTMLRNLGVRTLVVVGAWTNMAVEHTVRDAADHGYQVTLVQDATSSLSAEWQHAATNFALTNIATTSDTASVTAAMKADR